MQELQVCQPSLMLMPFTCCRHIKLQINSRFSILRFTQIAYHAVTSLRLKYLPVKNKALFIEDKETEHKDKTMLAVTGQGSSALVASTAINQQLSPLSTGTPAPRASAAGATGPPRV